MSLPLSQLLVAMFSDPSPLAGSHPLIWFLSENGDFQKLHAKCGCSAHDTIYCHDFNCTMCMFTWYLFQNSWTKHAFEKKLIPIDFSHWVAEDSRNSWLQILGDLNLVIIPHALRILTANIAWCIIILVYVNESQVNTCMVWSWWDLPGWAHEVVYLVSWCRWCVMARSLTSFSKWTRNGYLTTGLVHCDQLTNWAGWTICDGLLVNDWPFILASLSCISDKLLMTTACHIIFPAGANDQHSPQLKNDSRCNKVTTTCTIFSCLFFLSCLRKGCFMYQNRL